MKRMLAVLTILLLLTGCSSDSDAFDSALSLRERLLKSNGCEFTAVITADYGDRYYTFTVNCHMEQDGTLSFSIAEPASISGIGGKVSGTGGALTFDDQMLAFELLADGQITPVSAPWLMLNSLRSGFLHACSANDEGIYMQINDSFMEGDVQADIWLDSNDMPIKCELFWEGRRFLSIDVSNFVIL